jgi:hypothetical protein
MQFFLLKVKIKPLQDEIFKAIEDIFLNKAKVAGQFFLMDEALNLVVEADTLYKQFVQNSLSS